MYHLIIIAIFVLGNQKVILLNAVMNKLLLDNQHICCVIEKYGLMLSLSIIFNTCWIRKMWCWSVFNFMAGQNVFCVNVDCKVHNILCWTWHSVSTSVLSAGGGRKDDRGRETWGLHHQSQERQPGWCGGTLTSRCICIVSTYWLQLQT